MWHVYILTCSDKSLYTGVTIDVSERVKRHNSGRASKYTRSRRPVELAYTEECMTKHEALCREIEIKKLGAENKKRLMRYGSGKRFPSLLEGTNRATRDSA